MSQKLLIATHNQGKVREYRALLSDLPLEVTYLDAEGITFEAEETGATFADTSQIVVAPFLSCCNYLVATASSCTKLAEFRPNDTQYVR